MCISKAKEPAKYSLNYLVKYVFTPISLVYSKPAAHSVLIEGNLIYLWYKAIDMHKKETSGETFPLMCCLLDTVFVPLVGKSDNAMANLIVKKENLKAMLELAESCDTQELKEKVSSHLMIILIAVFQIQQAKVWLLKNFEKLQPHFRLFIDHRDELLECHSCPEGFPDIWNAFSDLYTVQSHKVAEKHSEELLRKEEVEKARKERRREKKKLKRQQKTESTREMQGEQHQAKAINVCEDSNIEVTKQEDHQSQEGRDYLTEGLGRKENTMDLPSTQSKIDNKRCSQEEAPECTSPIENTMDPPSTQSKIDNKGCSQEEAPESRSHIPNTTRELTPASTDNNMALTQVLQASNLEGADAVMLATQANEQINEDKLIQESNILAERNTCIHERDQSEMADSSKPYITSSNVSKTVQSECDSPNSLQDLWFSDRIVQATMALQSEKDQTMASSSLDHTQQACPNGMVSWEIHMASNDNEGSPYKSDTSPLDHSKEGTFHETPDLWVEIIEDDIEQDLEEALAESYHMNNLVPVDIDLISCSDPKRKPFLLQREACTYTSLLSTPNGSLPAKTVTDVKEEVELGEQEQSNVSLYPSQTDVQGSWPKLNSTVNGVVHNSAQTNENKEEIKNNVENSVNPAATETSNIPLYLLWMQQAASSNADNIAHLETDSKMTNERKDTGSADCQDGAEAAAPKSFADVASCLYKNNTPSSANSIPREEKPSIFQDDITSGSPGGILSHSGTCLEENTENSFSFSEADTGYSVGEEADFYTIAKTSQTEYEPLSTAAKIWDSLPDDIFRPYSETESDESPEISDYDLDSDSDSDCISSDFNDCGSQEFSAQEDDEPVGQDDPISMTEPERLPVDVIISVRDDTVHKDGTSEEVNETERTPCPLPYPSEGKINTSKYRLGGRLDGHRCIVGYNSAGLRNCKVSKTDDFIEGVKREVLNITQHTCSLKTAWENMQKLAEKYVRDAYDPLLSEEEFALLTPDTSCSEESFDGSGSNWDLVEQVLEKPCATESTEAISNSSPVEVASESPGNHCVQASSPQPEDSVDITEGAFFTSPCSPRDPVERVLEKTGATESTEAISHSSDIEVASESPGNHCVHASSPQPEDSVDITVGLTSPCSPIRPVTGHGEVHSPSGDSNPEDNAQADESNKDLHEPYSPTDCPLSPTCSALDLLTDDSDDSGDESGSSPGGGTFNAETNFNDLKEADFDVHTTCQQAECDTTQTMLETVNPNLDGAISPQSEFMYGDYSQLIIQDLLEGRERRAWTNDLKWNPTTRKRKGMLKALTSLPSFMHEWFGETVTAKEGDVFVLKQR